MAHDFPIPRTCPFTPPPEYGQLRDEAPVVKATSPGGPLWLVTRHAEARQVLSDPRTSASPATPGHPLASLAAMPDPGTGQVDEKYLRGQFIAMDPPEHSTYRRMLITEFTVRRLKATAPGIQQVVDELIDAMLARGSSADLVEAFGMAMPSLVICRLLGVPYADHGFFQSRTQRMVVGTLEDFWQAQAEIWEYLDGLIAAAEKDPGDNLIGRLVTERRRTGALNRDEMVGMVLLLLTAGHETTASMLPLGVLTLLRHPEQLAGLRTDPSLWPKAVEELLRYHSIVELMAFDRAAVEDMEVGGETIRAGEGIHVLNAAVNRDERVFEHPDEFDVRRASRDHIAFGFGVHQCLGANLARLELEIAYRTLFERIPTLRVVEDPPVKVGGSIFGLSELRVAWQPA